ncbi:xanthine phosphoribosyltransferase [Carboxydocella sp. JDF658]|nr:xanthine phosphoribosyltransferase [Carboxydocella sp. JDF658]
MDVELLKQRIREDGLLIGNNILKVDSFLNHQLDPQLLLELGREFARRFRPDGVTKILTVEASGIAVAVMVGLELGVPVLFAKKKQPSTLVEEVYAAEAFSFTKQEQVSVCVSRRYLTAEDRVLIIDDFLAQGAAAKALVSLVEQAGASLVGVGVVVEKAFQPGGKELREAGIRVEALARIGAFTEKGVEFV